MNWWKGLKTEVKLKHPLAGYTTFKIGGKADFFFQPRDIKELKQLRLCLNRYNIPYKILGAGSNILINDSRLRAVVIRLSEPYFKMARMQGHANFSAGAGLEVSGLLGFSLRHKLSGLEFMAGIPGTVGGAIVMNAGAGQDWISSRLLWVRVLDPQGKIIKLPKKAAGFAYRSSGLNDYIVLEAGFSLCPGKKELIRDKIRTYMKNRQLRQDLISASAGCVFKNPQGAQPAGKLIDLCGLKGKKKGGALVSSKHANFIVNNRGASFKDVSGLMAVIVRKVRKDFGVKLEPEIKIWK